MSHLRIVEVRFRRHLGEHAAHVGTVEVDATKWFELANDVLGYGQDGRPAGLRTSSAAPGG